MDFRFCPRCASPLVTRRFHDEAAVDRMACPDAACGFVHWGNPTPAVGVIVEHEAEVILARNAAWPPDFFALIAGFLEAREDPVHAVRREVKEELGLDVVSTTLVGNYIFERRNEVMLCYHAVAEGTVSLGAELAEYRRYRPQDLRPWRRATGLALADWMRARGLPVVWDDRPPLAVQPASAKA